MLDEAKTPLATAEALRDLDALVEAAVVELVKLQFTVKKELLLQESLGSRREAGAGLQARLHDGRPPLEALLEAMRAGDPAPSTLLAQVEVEPLPAFRCPRFYTGPTVEKWDIAELEKLRALGDQPIHEIQLMKVLDSDMLAKYMEKAAPVASRLNSEFETYYMGTSAGITTIGESVDFDLMTVAKYKKASDMVTFLEDEEFGSTIYPIKLAGMRTVAQFFTSPMP